MIPLFRPSYSYLEEEAIAQTLRTRWTGLGPKVEEFEDKFAHYVGSKYCVATNNCTSALQIALHCLGVREGHEVIVPALTFASTAHAVRYMGAEPVFGDINPDTLSLDWSDVIGNIDVTNHTTKSVIVVLYGGISLLYPFGRTNIVDCAHACGSSFRAAGKLCCWSFHAVKNLSSPTGDGGALTTDDYGIYERARQLRWMGISKSTHERQAGGYNWDYTIHEIGYKAHMSDVTAAGCLVQLAKMPEMQAKRKILAEHYYWSFVDGRHGVIDSRMTPVAYDPDGSHHLFVLRAKDRDALMKFLRIEKGIATGVHYKSLTLHPCYQGAKGADSIPNTMKIWPELVSLPLFPDMSTTQVEEVVNAVKEFYNADRN